MPKTKQRLRSDLRQNNFLFRIRPQTAANCLIILDILERRELESKYGCSGELVRLHCDSSAQVIQIVRANYGRLSSNICTTSSSSSSSSSSSRSLTDCLHRSSKTVLDRLCAGRSSCTVRAGPSVFQSSSPVCPGVEKYLEVHFRCVGLGEVGANTRHLLPPWLEDLSATFRPLSRPSSTSTSSTTFTSTTTSTTAPSTTTSTLSDNENILPSESTRPGGNVTKSGGNKGRYFLIHDQSDEVESDGDNSHTTLVITITISTVSTVLSILIIFILCRKFRGKRLSSGERSEANCYQCQAGELQPTPDKLQSLPVIPVQVSLEQHCIILHLHCSALQLYW